jgi:hypothetical protein
VTFEENSRLEQIKGSAFCQSGLKSIVIPSSVIVLGEESFRGCKSLESVTFEKGSRLECIEDRAFDQSGVPIRSIAKALSSVGLMGSVFQLVNGNIKGAAVKTGRDFSEWKRRMREPIWVL